MGEIDDAIDRQDVRGIVRAGIRAMRAEEEGRFCQCETPDMTGRKSYICFACDLPNTTRKAEIEAAMQTPHPYEVMDRQGGKPLHPLLVDSCCDFCAWPRNHRLHQIS